MKKEELNLTVIADALGLSRERLTRYHKKKAIILLTQEFSRVVRSHKRWEGGYNGCHDEL